MLSQSPMKDWAKLAFTCNTTEWILFSRSLPEKFAHLNDLSIRSYDCMFLRSFHTPSQYDFYSNVIRSNRRFRDNIQPLCLLGIFAWFFVVCYIFFKINFFNNFFQEYHCFAGSDLVQNCLQKWSADNTSRQRVQATTKCSRHFQILSLHYKTI